MRLKGKKTKKSFRPADFVLPLLAGLAILVAIWGNSGRIGGGDYYFCDMERVVEGGAFFLSNGHKFNNAKTQTDEFALSGSYSARCDADHIYGPGLSMRNVYSGDVVEATVWRKGDFGFGRLVMQGADGWKFNKESGEVVKVANGWELIKMSATVPLGVDNKSLKVFAYYVESSKGVVYFDDLTIRRTKNVNPVSMPVSTYAGEQLRLQVDQKDYEKMQVKRAEALSKSVLITGKPDLVKAKLHTADEVLIAQTRLKGDLTDHLVGSKWSFRIALDGKNAWKGMPEFSVHNSLSRHHLDEWMYHQLLQREDLLTTRYDFVEMALNEKVLGIYAYEEHFREALLHFRERMFAPIIRWNEDGLWQNASKGFQNRPPWFESAQIETFGGKNLLKDDEQRGYFETAQNLLYGFSQGEKSAEEVFDTDRLAKFLALTDLCIAFHSLNHTNLRFYFNPITAKLEPIGYDGYTPHGTKFFKLPLLTGSKINARSDDHQTQTNAFSFIHKYLFNDFSFVGKYAHYLEKYTSEAYLGPLKVDLLDEINAREKFIQREYTDYKFDWDFYFRHAKEIRKVLYPIEHIALKAYLSDGYLSLESYHILALEIYGYGDKTITIKPEHELLLEAFDQKVPVRRYQMLFPKKAKFVFCKTPGTEQIKKVPIMKWPAPVADRLAAPLASLDKLAKIDFIRIEKNGRIVIRPGTHTLHEDLLIPAGHILKISAGTNLILENGASIVSQSAVRFLGSASYPVRIVSENKTGQGLLVLETKEKSIMEHVIFKNLKAIDRSGQSTHAAITFYETDVSILHCTFENLLAKDALSFFHTKYDMSDCRFSGAAGDAIDANFSIGKIKNLYIENAGEDGLEISGGTLDVEKLTVKQAAGTGIHVNHHALAEAQLINVSNSKQAVIATDLAEISIGYLSLKNIEQGILAYQKLPEYGGGQVTVHDYEAEEVKELHLVEKGAVLKLKGSQVEVH